jgi:hypothetical protein
MFIKKELSRGEIVSYSGRSSRKLGIVLAEPFYSTGNGWQVKTYCDGRVLQNPVTSIEKVESDVQVIKKNNYEF